MLTNYETNVKYYCNGQNAYLGRLRLKMIFEHDCCQISAVHYFSIFFFIPNDPDDEF